MAIIKNLDQLINDLFADFTPKQVKVVKERFGIKNGASCTLQEIGDDLGITRERVRQIEEQCIKKLRPRVQSAAAGLLDFAEARLAEAGGVRGDDVFVQDMKQRLAVGAEIKHADQKLRFLFLLGGRPFFSKEDDTAKKFWYVHETAKKEFFDFLGRMTDVFEKGDKQKLIEGKAYLAHCKDLYAPQFLSVAKNFGTNIFGDIGLSAWPEINPKTVRDKIYLVLKKENKPLHFADIAKQINRRQFDEKPANVQTVHNELIKDERFILVGRGMYALREQGFEKGTVQEVIARLLKTKGPQSAEQIVRYVNEQRFLKENTILLGLQNKRFFKRLDDGRYHVKEV